MSGAQVLVQPLSVRGSPNPAINIIFRASIEMPAARLGYAVSAAKPQRKTVAEIQKVVAAHYGLTTTELISDCRMRYVARPRQVAMWIAKQITTRSLPDIGRRFGNRDHTTVLHAVRRIEGLIETNPEIARDCTDLLETLGGRPE